MTQKNLQFIVHLKGKLMPVDNIAPIILEFSRHFKNSKFLFVSSSEGYSDLINREIVYKKFFEQDNMKIISKPYDRNVLKVYYWRIKLILIILCLMLFNRVVLIDCSATKIMPRLLIKIQKKIWKGLEVITNLTPLDVKTRVFYDKLVTKSYNRPLNETETDYKDLPKKCDLILLSPVEFKKFNSKSKAKVINVGFSRGMPQWQRFLENINKNHIGFLESKFIFWPLSIIKVERWGHSFDISETILNTLLVLKKERPNLKVIFRYHPTTEIDEFHKILKESEFKNYEISFVHPQILIKKASFIFSNVATSLFCDACFLGKPVVQYLPYPNQAHVMFNKLGEPLKPAYYPTLDYFMFKENKFRKFLRRKDLLSLPISNGNKSIREQTPVNFKPLLSETSRLIQGL